MRHTRPAPRLPWLGRDDPFPPVDQAFATDTGLDGLLAAGADLSVTRLVAAYRHGIFPWYSEGQPILWWSPDPRMVLFLDEFRISRSLRKTVRARVSDPAWRFTMDTSFAAVIEACATHPRAGQDGTWITRDMRRAYCELHDAGHAHSFEAWRDDVLIGGGYGVALGRMFFGESMFALAADASKLALTGLVECLRARGFSMLDCQQNTRHLASLGAREIARSEFMVRLAALTALAPPADWPVELELPSV